MSTEVFENNEATNPELAQTVSISEVAAESPDAIVLVSQPSEDTVEDTVEGAAETVGDAAETVGNAAETAWQKSQVKAAEVFENLPETVGRFFRNNKSLLLVLAGVIAAFIGLKMLLSLIGALNDIPLLPFLFELVGIGYTTWFIYRYLLSAASRQELSEKIDQIKADLLGQSS